ncbi:MAG: peptidoglycan-binding domain-containing protein [Eubacteriales bacterium]|nr:peptidoglycan-binding domain-containing protein [Eubacteriales bacterium]
MGYKATVKGGMLHLREKMDVSSTKLADIPTNTTINVKETHDSAWAMAAYQEKLGYVMREYLDERFDPPAYGVEGYQHYGTKLLKKGSEGDMVALLQKDLHHLPGPQWASLKVDGIFGPNTEEAVTRYQGMCGIKQDGKAGVDTKGKLFEDSMLRGEHSHRPEPPHMHG